MHSKEIPYFSSLDDALASLFGNNIKILQSDRVAGEILMKHTGLL